MQMLLLAISSKFDAEQSLISSATTFTTSHFAPSYPPSDRKADCELTMCLIFNCCANITINALVETQRIVANAQVSLNKYNNYSVSSALCLCARNSQPPITPPPTTPDPTHPPTKQPTVSLAHQYSKVYCQHRNALSFCPRLLLLLLIPRLLRLDSRLYVLHTLWFCNFFR